MSYPVVVAYGRTACCRSRKGGLADVHPVDFSAACLKGVIAKVPYVAEHPEVIGDVITGCAMHINQMNMNASRLIVNRAGLPDDVPAQTINRFCSSGLQAISTAHNAIMAGQYKVAIAGGCEYMTGCFTPYDFNTYGDKWIMDNYPGGYMSMGQTAENVANDYGFTREQMDEMALESHTRAAAARKAGKLAPSIIPYTKEDGTVVDYDDGILADMDGNLKTSMEKMSSLKTCFVAPEDGGKVTAATSSQTTDAAAYVMLMDSDFAAEHGIKPIAKMVAFQVAGCDATRMGMGPVYAIPKALEQAGLKSVTDMDVIELNEAFASQAMACIKNVVKDPKLDGFQDMWDSKKVNPYGGAMALGHPMGATGAFLTSKALDYLRDPETKGKYAMVTMCIGGGMGACGIYELCE
ncbi:MAG: thiolase family protein [Oscillospiraceae bacterium]|nr:thiolase family protein [Oscillospiraceae bacterium]